MIKVIIFMKKNEGLSRAELIDYYENSHVPLIMKHMGQYLLDYRRSFPDWDDPISFSGNFNFVEDMRPEPTFDVVTEMWIKDRVTMDEMFAVAGDPALAKVIEADAAQFRIQSSVRMCLTEEYGMSAS
ncbi:MAG: EthD family reductase [Sphingomonadales bacterium]|nr:MAG: EthD family reductase [Sphingomonadales bacterium]